MSVEILILRLIHVLGGIFWVGTSMFTSLFLVPALASAGPNAGVVFAGLQRRKLFLALPVVAILTIASGARLMSIASGGSSAYFASPTGRMFSLAGLAAVIAFFISLLIARPAAVRSAKLGASLPTAGDAERAAITEELARLRRRGGTATAIVSVLLLLTAAGMAVARYVG